MSRNRFQRGHGVFKCISCYRQTRGDGDSHGCDMCGQCFDLAGWDNHFNDMGETPSADEMARFNSLLLQIGEKGGDMDRVKSINDYIWPGTIEQQLDPNAG